MSNGIKGSSALLETPLKLTENRWDYIYWTIQLVWLLSRCCSSWQCCINLDWKAQSVRTEQTLCAAAVNEGGKLQLNAECTLRTVHLWAALAHGRAVWRSCCSAWCRSPQHSSVQVQTCPAHDFVVDLLLLFPEQPSALKLMQNL